MLVETRGSHGAINIASFLLPGGPELPITKSLLIIGWLTYQDVLGVGHLVNAQKLVSYFQFGVKPENFTALGFDTTKKAGLHAKMAWPIANNEQE